MGIYHNGNACAVVYLRASSEDLVREGVLERQRRECEQVAARYGLTIKRVYVDIGSAGLSQQSALRQCLADLAMFGGVSRVLVEHPSLLSQDPCDIEQIVRSIHFAHAEVVTRPGVKALDWFRRLCAQQV